MTNYPAETAQLLSTARFSAEVPNAPVERRSEERHLTVLRVAKLILDKPSPHREVLCLIRDISTHGMMVRSYSQLTAGERVTVELRHGHHVSGTLVWTDGNAAGIHFDHRVDVLRLLGHDDATDAPHRNQRLPRLTVEVPVEVTAENHTLDLMIRNISIGGIRVEGRNTEILTVDERVTVNIVGFGKLSGVVRWQMDNAAGIAFLPALPLRALSHWAIEHGEGTTH